MMTLDTHALRGSITPLITPFRNGEVDYATYATLVERHIEEGGHGILVNGTSAEPSTLTVDERNRLVQTAIEAAKGRTQIVAATGSQSFAESQALTDFAAKAGVDALLIVTPYYIRPPQRGLVEYYAALGARSDLPLMIYHIPVRAAVNVELPTLVEIAERVPTLVGMKHASTDLAFVSDCLARLGADFRIFVGLEELSFPMLALGACGLMNAVGNLVPGPVARLYETTARGRSGSGPPRALRPARTQPRRVLGHQSDTDQIHGEASRHTAEQRTPATDGTGHTRARTPSRRAVAFDQALVRLACTTIRAST